MAKPTFVFVPGGFHTPGVYDKVISILEPQGYECIKVALPSISNELATKDISNDVEAIEAAVAGCVDEGKDVVFVAHSYGGVSTCQMPRSLSKTSRVSKDLKGGIIRIVIIAGFLVPEGFQTAPEGSIEAFPHDNFVVDVEAGLMHVIPEAAKKMWYHDIPEAEAEECLKTMVRHQSIGVFWSKTTVAAWRYIPTTYIYCGDDRTMPKAFAEKLVGDAKATKDHMIDTVEECEGSGHFPMLSRPDWVVGALKRAAGESES